MNPLKGFGVAPATVECGTIFDCRKDSYLSKDDLIDVQGTVVAVHSGGLYRVQCDQGHEVLAQLSGRMRRFRIKVVPGRSRDRRRFALRSGPRHHHLPRSLRTRFEFPYNTAHNATTTARRRRPVARRRVRAGASDAPHDPRRPIRRPQAEYDPTPVAFDTLGLEASPDRRHRVRGFRRRRRSRARSSRSSWRATT